MTDAMDRVVDAIDLETVLYCKDENEARELAEKLAREMNLRFGDIMFLEHKGWAARVRLRTYIHNPGDEYHWLDMGGEKE